MKQFFFSFICTVFVLYHKFERRDLSKTFIIAYDIALSRLVTSLDTTETKCMINQTPSLSSVNILLTKINVCF